MKESNPIQPNEINKDQLPKTTTIPVGKPKNEKVPNQAKLVFKMPTYKLSSDYVD